MTIAMLSLAGIPATAGFVGKFYLIDAAVDGGYTWLGVVIVVGSMISLGYYLRVIAAMWMRERATGAAPPRAPRAVRRRGPGGALLRDHPLAAVPPRPRRGRSVDPGCSEPRASLGR